MKFCKKIPSIFGCFLLLVACTSLRQPAPKIHYYTLNCNSPVFRDLPPVRKQILVKMYSGSSLLHTNDMTYRSGPYQLFRDPYHKWQERPKEMVLFCLLRDFQNSGLFQGVFGTGTVVKPEYVMEGRLDVFGEKKEKDGRAAVITVTVSLIRTGSGNHTVFQKQYVGKELLQKNDPTELARAMSAALEKISEQLLMDVYHRIPADAAP